MSRATLKDIAQLARVGVATVDRVLNGRAPVSAETANRVLAAAKSLDYHANGLLRRRIEEMSPAKTFGFILQKESKWFYQTLAEALKTAAKDLHSVRATVEIEFVQALSPDDLSDAVLRMSGKVDAIGLVAVDHPKVSNAIDAVAKNGVPVIALLSPLTADALAGYIGIDGRRAGRTAGWAMAKFLNRFGEVGILIGSHRYLGHEALEVGFRSYVRECAPEIQMRESLVYLDDAAVGYEAASNLLGTAPNLVGLYHCGGGVSGVVKALEESGRAKDIFYICHEESPSAVRGLQNGTVDLLISCPSKHIAVAALTTLADIVQDVTRATKPMSVDFRLVTPENCG